MNIKIIKIGDSLSICRLPHFVDNFVELLILLNYSVTQVQLDAISTHDLPFSLLYISATVETLTCGFHLVSSISNLIASMLGVNDVSFTGAVGPLGTSSRLE